MTDDSDLSLDGGRLRLRLLFPFPTPFALVPHVTATAAHSHSSVPIRLERIDPARNMARYYTLAVEVTLFDDFACTREFGRIGSRGGRIMIGLFDSVAAAEAELHALLRAKQARGYQLASR